jgi:hypothetical protein
MKFVFRKSVRFEAQVIVREPGSGAVFDFVGVFEIVPRSGDDDADFRRAFVGWRGIGDEGAPDNELPITEANKAALLGQPHVAHAVARAYFGELVRYPEKNAAAPAAPGPAPAPH